MSTQDPERNVTTNEQAAPSSLARERVAVTFQVKHSPYNAGETAGFTVPHAVRLVGFGRAILHDPSALSEEVIQQFPRFNQYTELRASQLPPASASDASAEDADDPDAPPEPRFTGGDPRAYTVADVTQWGATISDHDALEEVLEIEMARDDGNQPRLGVTSYMQQRLGALGPAPEKPAPDAAPADAEPAATEGEPAPDA